MNEQDCKILRQAKENLVQQLKELHVVNTEAEARTAQAHLEVVEGNKEAEQEFGELKSSFEEAQSTIKLLKTQLVESRAGSLQACDQIASLLESFTSSTRANKDLEEHVTLLQGELDVEKQGSVDLNSTLEKVKAQIEDLDSLPTSLDQTDEGNKR